MSWVTVIWSIGSGACLTLALVQLVVWWKDRTARASLAFTVMAVAVAAYAAFELALMRSKTPEQLGLALRWLPVPLWVWAASLVVFVRLYLKAGRSWLGWTVVGVRTVALILNFVFWPNIIYRQITAPRRIRFLGESVSVAGGVPNPWVLVSQVSLVLLVIFVLDATITAWRRGDRRQALMVGGSILFAVVTGSLQGSAIIWWNIPMPVTASLFYLALVAAMAYELSYDVLHAAQVTRRLQASEIELREEHQRMDLATAAAELGIWVWDVATKEIWISDKGRVLFGFAPSEKLDIERFRNAIHPDDRDSMRQAVENALDTGREYEAEHRVVLPNGRICWLAERGRVEFSGDGKPAVIRGASLDITRRKLREAALQESEARFRTMANAAPVLIWMSGTDKLCTFFNKPWLDFTGRTIEQEMGNGWAEGVHPDDLQRCLKIYIEAFDAGQPFVMQYRLRRHDGEYRWISDHGVPRYDTQKNFAGYIGSCVDITELKSNEEALRESEERMSLALDAAKLGLWEWNVSKDEIWGSKARRALLGLASGNIKLEDALSRVHVDDRNRVRQALKEAVRTGKDCNLEYRVVLADGSIRWTEHRARCVREADGKDLILRGVSIDVTEQKRAEEKFRLAVEASPSGILLVNQTGQIVLVNSHIEELFGYGREELIGHSVEILVSDRFAGGHPALRAGYFAAPEKRMLGRGRELFGRRKDRSEFPLEIGLNPIQTPEGTLVLASVVDISERKRAEEKFRMAVEASPSGILLVNETGQIVLVNSQIEELFGYGRDELIGHSVEILVPERFARHHPEHRSKFFAAPAARAMGAGRELFARRKDGSEFPVEIGLNPIQTPEGMLILAAVVDISARKESESEALRHREELSHLSRVAAMGELAASIAHELNQPLSGITINASTGQRLIDRGDGDLGELRNVLSDIVADARRAGEVIRGIQNMVKKGSSARQRLNLNDLVTNTVRMVIPNAMLHSCELEILLEPNLPEVEADPVQIQQVLLNLVINALDAIQDAPVGRRKVLIATERSLTGAIRTSVRDYGNGIPEEVRARVFEQFFTTKAKGLGMGLAIVQTIIKSHGGSIVAENADDGGARFHFTLPTTDGRAS